MESAIGLIKGEAENLPDLVESVQPVVQVAAFGAFDVLIWEGRFESLTEYQKFWDSWVELPTTEKFFENWLPLTEAGGQNELWEVR
jgi:hypothetical protein